MMFVKRYFCFFFRYLVPETRGKITELLVPHEAVLLSGNCVRVVSVAGDRPGNFLVLYFHDERNQGVQSRTSVLVIYVTIS